MRSTKTIAILAMPGVQLLDVSGPLDVFAEANVQAHAQAYRLKVIASRRGAIQSSSGVRLMPDEVIGDEFDEPIHTLLVAGTPHAASTVCDLGVSEWLRRRAPKVRRFGSVCSGAFVLAQAGLLDGRRVTTHWAVAEQLAQDFPSVTVDADAIHVRDGRLRTAAGVTAGLDLALALVEEDLGREIAMKVAAQLVMFFKRPGGQMQFSRKGEAAPAGRSALQEVQRWVAANPATDHGVASLAARMGLSERHFARLFRQEVGVTPAAWVEDIRVAAARRLLEAGDAAPKQVASLCGFADADTLRRAFQRQVGITPAEYRKRFAHAIA
ncbi:GlxA family transcriptional regulator [Variovorax sp. J22G73]|jgi:transcriptional regulator GlxA family with amidase domain|uniref:GlxA family transcriptional regulator n=1 Tax=unclassified Variovorax TaxID=663243 RepID=UPI000D5D61F2|nr:MULTISPECIES: GlxA family transcriptional regulator [unclassified Variovorax]MDM0008963.1 GlxA family transcriptional regulator [Variovorax sp. J22R203]MDM0101470.1 GlxA family transcriptional regulator [Variovorax sp. J22G73]